MNDKACALFDDMALSGHWSAEQFAWLQRLFEAAGPNYAAAVPVSRQEAERCSGCGRSAFCYDGYCRDCSESDVMKNIGTLESDLAAARAENERLEKMVSHHVEIVAGAEQERDEARAETRCQQMSHDEIAKPLAVEIERLKVELTAEIEQAHHFASERDEAETKLTAERTRGVALRDEVRAHHGRFAPVWIMKAIAAYDAGAGAKP
jgi:hypothetical protein